MAMSAVFAMTVGLISAVTISDMLAQLFALVEAHIASRLGTWMFVSTSSGDRGAIVRVTGLHMVFELTRSPKLKIAAVLSACEWLLGWILVAALVGFEMLVPHVAGAASFEITDEGSLPCVASYVLSQLGRLGVALAATVVGTVMPDVIGPAARPGYWPCNQR